MSRQKQPCKAGMRKKQKLLRTRYLTDIVSRFKLGALEDELNDRIADYKDVAEPNDSEYTSFVTSIYDAMYTIQLEKYEDMLKHERIDPPRLKHIVKYVPFHTVRRRLHTQIREWIQAYEDKEFEAHVERYERLLLGQKATLDDIYDSIFEDGSSIRVQRRLYTLVEYWARERLGPINELGQLATDNQNVHTFAINNLTNDMLSLLKQVPIPQGQKTMAEILNEWTTSDSSVERDMRLWGLKTDIIEKGDCLYRNTLRSVWAKIKTYSPDLKKELVRRLWEECYESVGMCAQGHISRLANVFVGYDDQFQTPLSATEQFQEKMAEIARMPEDKKKEEATLYMDMINMPMDERQVWLDAF